MLRLLGEHGANTEVTATDSGTPLFHSIKPLRLAIMKKDLDAVTILLDMGADINEQPLDEETPLALAIAVRDNAVTDSPGGDCHRRSQAVVDALVAAGAVLDTHTES